MTFTLLEVVAVAVGIAVIAGVIAFVQLSRRLAGTAREVEHAARRVTALAPSVQALFDNGEAEMRELRELTRKTSEIASDVQAVTGEASAATSHVVRALEGHVAGRYSALIAGARAGLDVLRHVRGNGSDKADRHDDVLTADR